MITKELEFTQQAVSKIYTARLKPMHLLTARGAKNSEKCPVLDRILMIFVYRCDVIPFDMTGNNNDTGGPIDDKSNQWFGASITSSGDDGVIVVSDLLHSWEGLKRIISSIIQFIDDKNTLLSVIIMIFIALLW